eukprot:gene20093-20633_t
MLSTARFLGSIMTAYQPAQPSLLTKAAVHKFAESIAVQVGWQPGGDINAVMEKLGGCVEIEDTLLTHPDQAGSLYVDSPTKFRIIVPAHTSPERDRFTIAHEFGHFVLHYLWKRQKDPTYPEKIVAFRRGSDRIEWEANWFAGAFLMPADAYRRRNKGEGFGLSRLMAKSPQFLEPRLRLFLGADIVGSTALKQTRLNARKVPTDQAAKGPAWFSAIQGFYFEAAQAFLFDWERSKSDSEQPELFYGPAPTLWKTVGDEVLFVKLLTDHRQLAVTLQCWMRALKRMKDFLRGESSILDVKSTCWTAGFPFRNREVVLDPNIDIKRGRVENYYRESGKLLNEYYRNPSKSRLAIDYIGPSIDTGFRLSGYATGRKFVVSVDVAYLISMTQFDGEIKRLDFFYDGSVSLKGVLGGLNYPIFWLDMSIEKSLARREDKLKAQTVCAGEDVKEYCEAFYQEHSDFTFRPFILNDLGQKLAKKPHWYDEYQSKLVENFQTPDSDYTADDKEEAERP